jgi:uncharacterized SAM-binding protein YcdF (DUF218 family)
MFKFLRKIIWIVAIAIVLLVVLPLAIGWYLSPQDALQKVDAIVVVSGGDNDARISKGVQLYKEGWAPVLIFSGAAASGDVSNAKAMANIAIREGVPEKALIIEERSKTTAENATFTSDLMKQNSYESFILVTSPYHQRRTYELFKKENPLAKIVNQSALDNSWRKKGWWQTNVGRFLTIGEVSKVLIIYGEELWQGVQR